MIPVGRGDDDDHPETAEETAEVDANLRAHGIDPGRAKAISRG